MKVWTMIMAAGVAGLATVASAAPIVTVTEVSSPGANLKRYIFTAESDNASPVNAFAVDVASGAMNVWKTTGTAVTASARFLDRPMDEGWGPDAYPVPAHLIGSFGGGTQILFDTIFLDATSGYGGNIFTSPISSETNNFSKNGVYGALGALRYGSGSYHIEQVALSPQNYDPIDFFQLVILADAGPVTVTGSAARPGATTNFSITVNDSQPIPVPAALPLGAAALALLGLRRRLA